MFGSRYGFGNAYFEVADLISSVAMTVLMACMATIGIMFGLFLYSDISCNEMRESLIAVLIE